MQSGTNEISYRYDASGNRLYLDQTGCESLEYGYLTGNILCYNYKYDTAREEYADCSYDNNGNLLSKTGVPVNITNTYDGFNRLISSAAGENPVSLSYEYNGDGLRTAKTAKGTRTDFIWDGDRLVCEISGESVTVYKYGNRLFGFEKDGVKKYYNFNGHGDVTGITNSSYTQIKSYEYDAFGVEKNPDPADTNPFRYCAEYYDAETGYIYLRARYYDVKDGRFISEDPAKDGLNWYVYCGNNPVNFVDPFGLFDYNTKLSKSNHYSDDVKVLQNELAWWGYYKGAIDGYFGNQTLSAVNAYKNAKGLWNFGQYNGVVGVTTWESLGLIYRTKDDIAAGVQIVTNDCIQVYDITTPFNKLLNTAKTEAEKWYNTCNAIWFYKKVNHECDWDIKRPIPWFNAMRISYPGSSSSYVVYRDHYTTPEELGNFLYGYAGTAAKFSEDILIAGSIFASRIWKKNPTQQAIWGEFTDHTSIRKGIRYYNEGY